MLFGRRKLTDEEFVERMRRQMTAVRKMAFWIIGLYATGMLVWCYAVCRLVGKLREVISNSAGYDSGFAFGALAGLFFMSSFFFLSFHLIQAILMASSRGIFRIHRLLVKYYDEARQHV